MSSPIYKICSAAAWDEARRTGALAPSPADERDGFIHLSAADQVRGTAEKHFAGQPNLVLLTVDPDRLPPGTLRWEPSRGGALFPHLYAPLAPAYVVAVQPLPLGPDGVPQLPG